VAQSFSKIGIAVRGIHQYDSPKDALIHAKAIFTGGGNTFVLVKELYDQDLMNTLKEVIEKGTPYLGCSAGSNIAGMTMHTTNDMPIVMPKSFETTAVVPFNINAHYMDPIKGLKHNGESRIDRIAEFQHFHKIPVVGIPEGDYIRVIGDKISLVGPHKAKLFIPDEEPIDTDKLPF
jgi:dipeptidase E